MQEQVILVDAQDREIGTADKLQAHVDGLLHRAFSVFIINVRGELLLQQRNPDKYHSGGLWSNTCCSHPRPGEAIARAAARRLQEEMGLEGALEPAFSCTYKVRLGDLWEHEYLHVFVGYSDQDPLPDPNEVSGWRWAAPDALAADVENRPECYTYWFRQIYQRVLALAQEGHTKRPASTSR
jgi:isopentenyl-diphosphate Delta-isomerase